MKNHSILFKLCLTVFLIIGTNIARSDAQDTCISGDISMLIKAAQCYAKAALVNDFNTMCFLSTQRNKNQLGLKETELCKVEIDKILTEAPNYEYTAPIPAKDGTIFVELKVSKGEDYFIIHLYFVNEKGCWKVDREAIVGDLSGDIIFDKK